MHEAGETLDELFWSASSLRAQAAARELGRGARLHGRVNGAREGAQAARASCSLGPTTMYASMQACGLVNDHIKGCVALKALGVQARHAASSAVRLAMALDGVLDARLDHALVRGQPRHVPPRSRL